MNNNTPNILSNVILNDPTKAAESFKAAIGDKLKDALDLRKVRLTSEIYNNSKSADRVHESKED